MRLLVLVTCATVLGGGGAVGAQSLSTAPGPLERQARPISAANPIPKRVLVVMPMRPSDVELAGARAVVTLRVTIDDSGSVAEVRSACCGLIAKERSLTGSDAFIRAATDAVRMWRYEPPVDPPVSFDVTVAFRSDGSSRLAADQASSGRLFEGHPAGAVPATTSVRPPIKTKHVAPVYPSEALVEGLSGAVVLEARIEIDGHIEEASVIRSVSGLDQAALAAVRQWEYETPLVNGVPTPIQTIITIEFTIPDAR